MNPPSTSRPRAFHQPSPADISYAQRRIQEGDRRLQRGSYGRALRAYTHAMDRDPTNPAAYTGRSQARWRLGNSEGAQEDVERALALNPRFANALVWQGHMAMQRGSDLSAVVLPPLRTAREEAPEDGHVLSQLALTHVRRGADDDALPLLNELLQQNPNHLRARLLRSDLFCRKGRVREALEDVDYVLQNNPLSNEALARRGNLLMAMNRHPEALRDYARAGNRAPEAARAFYRQPHNVEILERVLEEDSRDEFGVQLHADLDRHRRYWENATVGYTRVLNRNPQNVDALAGRADTHMDRGNAREARHDVNQALQIDPTHALALVVKGDYLRKRRRAQEAIPYYDRAISNNAGERAYVGKAKAHVWLREYSRAHDTLDQLINLSDAYRGLASQQRGMLYLDKGNWNRAHKYFSRAILINNRDYLAYAGRGEAERKQHHWHAAIDDFTTALAAPGSLHDETYQLAYHGREKAKKSLLHRRPYLYLLPSR